MKALPTTRSTKINAALNCPGYRLVGSRHTEQPHDARVSMRCYFGTRAPLMANQNQDNQMGSQQAARARTPASRTSRIPVAPSRVAGSKVASRNAILASKISRTTNAVSGVARSAGTPRRWVQTVSNGDRRHRCNHFTLKLLGRCFDVVQRGRVTGVGGGQFSPSPQWLEFREKAPGRLINAPLHSDSARSRVDQSKAHQSRLLCRTMRLGRPFMSYSVIAHLQLHSSN